MTETTVVNISRDKAAESRPNYVYIGRPSKWGNPFSHRHGTLAKYRVGTRQEAIDAYEQWLKNQPALVTAARNELKGKILGCWCHPLPCHGHVLAKIANE